MDSLEQDVLDYFINKNQNIKVIKTPDQSETDFTKALREIHQHITKENLEVCALIWGEYLLLGTNILDW